MMLWLGSIISMLMKKVLLTNFKNVAVGENECYKGNRIPFEELLDRNVSTSDLHRWSIPLDIADAYGAYSEGKDLIDVSQRFICNCSTTTTFGRFCEYEWSDTSETIVEETIQSIADAKNSTYPADRLLSCYTLIETDTNTNNLCLDYRDVCDGESDLLNGQDETYCHLVEMNECESDEFRCRNDMCIDRQYLFDAEADCLDLTDEQRPLAKDKYKDYVTCYERASIDCDDHWCGREELSCGDGQCLLWNTRFWYHPDGGCHNGFSFTYNCPISEPVPNSDRKNLFVITGNNGRCTMNITDVIEDDNSKCMRAVLCSVTLHPSCEYLQLLYSTHEDALVRVQKECQNQKITYAFGIQFFSPFVQAYYTLEQYNISYQITFWILMKLKQPALFCFVGTKRCENDIEVTHNGSVCLSYDDVYEKNYPYPPFEYLFCLNAGMKPLASMCNKYPKHFFRYPKTGECISKYRLFDGFSDSLYGTDEQNYTAIVHVLMPKHAKDRYLCGNVSLVTSTVMRYFLGK
ncbi:unnamed protein product [Didymodactylos carnosus]|uniref:Uncharacterized protein n=1 Tax=Didymodactylos carnosus TaxID=1234261 RepID=A0A814YQA7_9BILA|nr:unnamed protein product [Didymodactylos carnosus]CAF1231893.1 unnamed protein product [Didymodactylos carnosus]CAF3812811.1 unnamed protein product [Didymodactylos carnosus]CAF3994529.1 unnamed protein product [Didymodactylos carnosus]